MGVIPVLVEELLSLHKKIDVRLSAALSDKSIKKFNKKNMLVEGKLNDASFNPTSIELHLSNKWKREIANRVEVNYIDPNIPPKYEEGRFTEPADILDPHRSNPWEPDHYTEHEHYILSPKSYVIIPSIEMINIPNGYIGYISNINSKIHSGLSIETESILEAGYRDHISFSIFNKNHTSIVLFSKMVIAKIAFIKAEKCSFLEGGV